MKKLLLLLLLLPGAGFAQQTTINGSEHPELIPEEAAARAVCSVHSMYDTPANRAPPRKAESLARRSCHLRRGDAGAVQRPQVPGNGFFLPALHAESGRAGQTQILHPVREAPHAVPHPETDSAGGVTMKTITLLCLLLLPVIAMAQSYTLYYSDIETVNSDNSVTVTPTVAILGNDGAYCDPFEGYTGYEYPLVMLNGNAWQLGPKYAAVGGAGTNINFARTFPNVTLPANGSVVDLSYAGKIQGVCKISRGGGWVQPLEIPFYSGDFLDGSSPIAPPYSPCFVAGLLGSPSCPTPLPDIFTPYPLGWVGDDLASQQVGQTRSACPTLAPIIQEYTTYGVTLNPDCADFTQTAHSVYFTFSELNTGDYQWALIRLPLTVAASSGYGLDAWRTNYGSSRIVNSAYRNPARNAAVGGAPQSRHMFGDAVDLRNQGGTLAEWNAMVAAATTAGADFIEPQNGPCALACTHADWRSHAGGYQQ